MQYLRTKSGQLFKTDGLFSDVGTRLKAEKHTFVQALIGDTWVEVKDMTFPKEIIELCFPNFIEASRTTKEVKPFASIGEKKFSDEVISRMSTWKDNESNPDEIFLFGTFKHQKVYLDGSSGLGNSSIITSKEKFNEYRDWYNRIKGSNNDYINAKTNKPWLLFRKKEGKAQETLKL